MQRVKIESEPGKKKKWMKRSEDASGGETRRGIVKEEKMGRKAG